MRIFGIDFNIGRTKAAPPVLTPPAPGWNRVLEPYSGAWQAGVEISQQDLTRFAPVFACMSLIASDIGKLRPKFLKRGDTGVWQEDDTPPPLLRNPNQFQTMQQLLTDWVYSLLRAGNAYILLESDARNVGTGMWVLSPERVTPLVTPNGTVYYKLRPDNLAGFSEEIIVPSKELIHHRINTMYHPLIGISPLCAAGLAAQTGANISKFTAAFFGNAARPGGILTAPGHISDENAARLKEAFVDFRGTSAGSIAVVGDGLKFEQLAINSTDAQLLELLRLSAEQVAMAFKVPAFMIGAAPAPAVANAELLQQQYYRSCLQSIIEGIENGLDAGLELDDHTAIELDVEGGLLRLDTSARYASYETAMRAGWLAPNEARRRENLPPVDGGDSPMIQQQNYSLAALAKRDESETPFVPAKLAARLGSMTEKELLDSYKGNYYFKQRYVAGDVVTGRETGKAYICIEDVAPRESPGMDMRKSWICLSDRLASAKAARKSERTEHAVGEIVNYGTAQWKCVGPGRYRAVGTEEATS